MSISCFLVEINKLINLKWKVKYRWSFDYLFNFIKDGDYVSLCVWMRIVRFSNLWELVFLLVFKNK